MVAFVHADGENAGGTHSGGDPGHQALSETRPLCNLADGGSGMDRDILNDCQLSRRHALVITVTRRAERHFPQDSGEPV